MADWCKADPQRLKGVAIVPYLDPTEAARELDRAVSRLDNIRYASDYPHWDSEWPHTVDELLKRDDLEPRVKAKILGQNALRFYDLKGGHR